MDPLLHIESLFAILIVSFEVQIQSISMIGNRQAKDAVTAHSKRMIEALLNLITNIENEFDAFIEHEAEDALETSAMLSKAIAEAKNEMPGFELLDTFANIAKNGHRTLTSSLSQKEEESKKEVGKRFSVMRKKASMLLSQIERC